MRTIWIRLTLFYLLLTAATGVLMRMLAFVPLPQLDYGHLLHAHSHTALLGWGYMALFLLVTRLFLNDTERSKPQLKLLFWATQLAIAGMFVSFTLQGYAFFSIAFSTIHILLSYWFGILVWRRMKQSKPDKSGGVSVLYMKGSLACMAVSSLGPWMLAVLSANDLKGSALYDAAIYFYLHFQYNGWFTLGLIAILLRLLEQQRIDYSVKLARWQFALYAASMAPSFLLSILWLDLHPLWHAAAAAGAILQGAAVAILLVIIWRARSPFPALFQGWGGIFTVLACLALLLKATMEIGTVVPGLSELIYTSRDVVIGYLHLTLLGFVSFLCLAFFLQQGWLRGQGKGERLGYMCFVTGFIVNELVLFLNGLLGWTNGGRVSYENELLLIASGAMAGGILLVMITIRRRVDA
ncbi:hypothetical protein K0T92_10875 [Paenibacillus oenotherae]|uniref:Uncharacterized protein n=1 Tax=Paenibacillus oenotherae TaxID=1435645 RepID=A0ABS7D5N1_9BACL|nr:hypothetical protein [Paenibacillus oenotherae]MBW7475250.1 hypothetical protein [Paenibacillus oenotherae]